jgi:cardiolipin synthase A/B
MPLFRTQAHMIAGNRVTLLHDGAQCLPAMLRAIEGATREILLEMYWFGSDTTGRRFALALQDKARAGVRVAVLYDAVGSLEADRSMFDEMRAAGCEVFEFNPLRWPWQRGFLFGNRRNHRKQLVVDGRLGMTGGVNLGDPWAAKTAGGQGFRDDLVCIEGPAVASMREICTRALRRHGATAFESLPVPERCGEVAVHVLTNEPRRNRRVIEGAYLAAIQRSQRSILIENSYFIPGFFVRRALVRAVQRGVDVRVVVPHESDVPVVSYATRKLYGYLLSRGLRVFEWSAGILHSKVAVIDDWVTVGTHNLDYRSWRYNLEVNVILEDAAVAQRLTQRIEQAIGHSVEIELKTWRYRPLLQRLLEQFFYRFRRFL